MPSSGSGSASGAAPTPSAPSATAYPLATPAQVREEMGLLPLAFAWGEDDERLEELLEPLLVRASNEIRIYSTSLDALYLNATGSRTELQGQVLAHAESLLATAAALRRPGIMKALGVHEPLAMESAAEIAAEADRLREEALGLLNGLVSSVADQPVSTPFARPSFGASTFVPSSSDLVPSQRNALLDESDDLSAWALPVT